MGKLIKALIGCVPCGHQQSAVIAEHTAVVWASANVVEGDAITIISDCEAVVDSFRRGYKWAGDARRPQAGYWRTIKQSGCWHYVTAILKVKAHREEAEAVDAEEKARAAALIKDAATRKKIREQQEAEQ